MPPPRLERPSLLGDLGLPQRAQPIATRTVAARPLVLLRQQRVPQQLSLFGPPGFPR